MHQRYGYKFVAVDRKDSTYHDVIAEHSADGCRPALRNLGTSYRLALPAAGVALW